MKLSFTLPSKSSSKPKVTPSTGPDDTADDGDRKEFVTEFDPSKTLTDSKPKHVIPPMENEWRPYKKMKNLDLPFQADGSGSGLQFEVETLTGDVPGTENISYGLNLRQNNKESAELNGGGSDREDEKSENVEQVLLRSLRDDLKRLPEDRGFEEFQDVPVESFAAALLAGYGWKEGQGIGKNAKEDVKVKEYKKWTYREGLGFEPDRSRDQDTKIRAKDSAKSETRGSDGLFVGKEVRIVAGRDIGLKGEIMEKLGSDMVVLKLSRSKEEVEVGVNEIADLGSKEEERCLKKLKELKIREERQSSHKEKDKRLSKHSRETDREKQNALADDRVGEKNERGHKVPSWLRSHIRVRIISKDLKGGRLYRKKGVVVDVVGPTICDIAMDETRELVQGVDQELLETALPRTGGPVVVLYGKHKGAYGCLEKKDLDRETGVVRDADSHKMLDVQLDQIAEFMGDPSDVGY